MKNYKEYTDRVHKCITEVIKEEKIYKAKQPKGKTKITTLAKKANRKWLFSKIETLSLKYKLNPVIIATIYGA